MTYRDAILWIGYDHGPNALILAALNGETAMTRDGRRSALALSIAAVLSVCAAAGITLGIMSSQVSDRSPVAGDPPPNVTVHRIGINVSTAPEEGEPWEVEIVAFTGGDEGESSHTIELLVPSYYTITETTPEIASIVIIEDLPQLKVVWHVDMEHNVTNTLFATLVPNDAPDTGNVRSRGRHDLSGRTARRNPNTSHGGNIRTRRNECCVRRNKQRMADPESPANDRRGSRC